MMEKIKNFYGSHPIRWTLLTLVLVAAIVLLVWYAPAFSMQAAGIPADEPAATAKGDLIPYETVVSNGKATRKGSPVVVAEQAGRTLTFNPVEMIFTLTDANGVSWSTAMPGATEGVDKALLLLEFVGANNVFTTFNSYDNGTQLYASTVAVDPETGLETGTTVAYYDKAYQIENGVRIEMRVLDNTKKLLAYLPRTLSKESYDFFMTRIAELEAEGTEVPYKGVFMDFWRADPTDPNKYPFQTSGNSAGPSADRQIIALAEQVGYTREMLLADCATFQGEEGLMPGDRVLSVDGEKIYIGSDISMLLSINPSHTHDFVVERNGKTVYLNDLPNHEHQNEDGSTYRDYGFQIQYKEATFQDKMVTAWNTTLDNVRNVRLSLVMLFTGKASLKDMTGPVGLVGTMSDVAEQSETWVDALLNMLYFGGFIAVNLGVMNLLPIPALDGGRVVGLLLTTGIEAVTRKKINPKYEGYIHAVGMILLLGLMAVIMFKDVFMIFKG